MISIAVEDEIEIRQSRSRVYAFVSDQEHLPAWMAGVSRASRTSPGPIGVGTQYRVVGRMLGRRVESTYELTAYEPETMFSGRMTSKLFSVDETYRFEEEGDTTRVQLTAEAQPGRRMAFLGPMLAMAMPRQVKADHLRLKRILEARPRRAAKAKPVAPPAPAPAPTAPDAPDLAEDEASTGG